jgi:YVTN family beta-propeller protein
VKRLEVGQRPRQAAFSPDGARAYVTGESDRTLTAIDANTHTVVRTIRLSGEIARPMEVDVSADGRLVWVTTGRGGTLVAIDTTTYESVRMVSVGQRP